MQRIAMKFLKDWLYSEDRKPLVIRGARQVGKTWLVKHLAKTENRELIELNLEKNPQLASLFNSNDPRTTIINLNASLSVSIDTKKSILFLDEIQATPELFAKLRWFYEDMPELPVIVAGSLLEFVLADHTFSMPVGRISYMHVEPLSFQEFLSAQEKESLVTYIKNFEWNTEIPEAIHNQLIGLYKEYMIIGGMPQAVASWIKKYSLDKVRQVHQDLLTTYRDDFAKYSGRLSTERLEEVMISVPKFLGEKFVYSRVNPSINTPSIKQALNLLCNARICHKVKGSAANGVPLGAETTDKFLKIIFLDVGLCSSLLGLSFDTFLNINELILINSGGIAEQIVGQTLRTVFPPYVEPSLYYWHKSEKGSNAEIDYLLQHGNQIVPLEVKAGSTGSLKSLHLFMDLKKLSRAARINSDFPSRVSVSVKSHQDKIIQYDLVSIPFYMLEEIHRLLK